MIQLLVLRHAQAVDMAASDFSRELTGKGQRQSKIVGNFCLKHQLVPEIILTSPVLRARQTADRVAAVTGVSKVIEVDSLACGASPQDYYAAIREAGISDTVMVVGHQPDLGELLCDALGCSCEIEVKKAALIGLDLHGLRSAAAALRFQVPVSLM